MRHEPLTAAPRWHTLHLKSPHKWVTETSVVTGLPPQSLRGWRGASAGLDRLCLGAVCPGLLAPSWDLATLKSHLWATCHLLKRRTCLGQFSALLEEAWVTRFPSSLVLVKLNPVHKISSPGSRPGLHGTLGGKRDCGGSLGDWRGKGVAVSWGCHDNVPQMGQLKTTGSYSLTDLEARSPKSRYQQYTLLLKPVRESPSFSSSFWWWMAASPSHMDIFFLCVSLSSSYEDSRHWVRAHPTPVHPHLNRIYNGLISK